MNIKITQIKSGIDRPERQKRTLQALGLRKLNSYREVEATPQILGMITKVNHLVKVENVDSITIQQPTNEIPVAVKKVVEVETVINSSIVTEKEETIVQPEIIVEKELILPIEEVTVSINEENPVNEIADEIAEEAQDSTEEVE